MNGAIEELNPLLQDQEEKETENTLGQNNSTQCGIVASQIIGIGMKGVKMCLLATRIKMGEGEGETPRSLSEMAGLLGGDEGIHNSNPLFTSLLSSFDHLVMFLSHLSTLERYFDQIELDQFSSIIPLCWDLCRDFLLSLLVELSPDFRSQRVPGLDESLCMEKLITVCHFLSAFDQSLFFENKREELTPFLSSISNTKHCTLPSIPITPLLDGLSLQISSLHPLYVHLMLLSKTSNSAKRKSIIPIDHCEGLWPINSLLNKQSSYNLFDEDFIFSNDLMIIKIKCLLARCCDHIRSHIVLQTNEISKKIEPQSSKMKEANRLMTKRIIQFADSCSQIGTYLIQWLSTFDKSKLIEEEPTNGRGRWGNWNC